MFDQLLGGLVNKEKAIADTLNDTIEDIKDELGLSAADFIIVIKPTAENKTTGQNFKCVILKATPDLVKSVPSAIVRDITLKEIIGE